MKVIAKNKRAKFDYELIKKYLAGISLYGSEVKSIKLGDVNLSGSFIRIENGEAFIYGMNVSKYQFQNIGEHDPLRKRKLLLNKREIKKINDKITLDRLVSIPTAILVDKKGLVKIEFYLSKSRKKADKREYLKEREFKKQKKDY